MSPRYPFSAIVGQQPMKLALVLNAINPRIGGVLIRGQKGTAKSTAARGLSALLPPLEVVDGCRFACPPERAAPRCVECQRRDYPSAAHLASPAFVELPVGATEDRVIGTLDVERILADGQRHFEPGLLARANRGLLYVDEVNLLPDHLVDTLLDAAAMGVNTVERDGVSFTHPAAFVLVGTMNPEEGDLRPQLLDRFALAVDVESMPSIEERAEVVRRRIAFEHDAAAFARAWSEAEASEAARINAAQELLDGVAVPDSMLDLIARICTAFEVDGLRADIVTYKAAATLAAYAGRGIVTPEDVRQAAELALPHRRRRQPFDQPGLDQQKLNDVVEEFGSRDDRSSPPPDGPPPRADEDGPHPPPSPPHRPDDPPESAVEPPTAARDTVFDAASVPDLNLPAPAPTRRHVEPTGRLSRRRATLVTGTRGRHVRSVATRVGAVDMLATVRAATLRSVPVETSRGSQEQVSTGTSKAARSTHIVARQLTHRLAPADTSQLLQERVQSDKADAASSRQNVTLGIKLHHDDVRFKLRASPVGSLTVFVVDASGSMAARRRMALAKGAVLRLLLRAYQTRDEVALIAFRGAAAEVLLPPTSSVHLASLRLRDLPTGGRTPWPWRCAQPPAFYISALRGKRRKASASW